MNDVVASGGLNASAIVMLIFGCVVLYGGIALCLRTAMRQKAHSNDAGETE